MAQCARCHGPEGQGTGAGTPLWGDGSFTLGAGMARYRTAAAFVHANMPRDRPGSLSLQDALDVAAFVDSRPRRDFAGKEKDWPKGGAPRDTPYPTTGPNPSAVPRPNRDQSTRSIAAALAIRHRTVYRRLTSVP